MEKWRGAYLIFLLLDYLFYFLNSIPLVHCLPLLFLFFNQILLLICQGVLVDRLFFVPSLCLFLIPFSPCSNSTHAIYAIFGASKELLGGFSTNTLPFSYDEFQ